MEFGNQKTGKSMLGTRHFIMMLLASCLSIIGCGKDPTCPQYRSETEVYWLSANLCDSPVSKLVMEFKDPGTRLIYTFDVDCNISTAISIPTGSDISILIQGFSPDDEEVSRGQITMDIDPDINSTITIPLESLIGSRTLEVMLCNVFSQNTFNSDTEGWTSWNNGQADVVWAGGSNRCLSLTDASDGIMAFRAPAHLRDGANLSSCYGAQLKYRMKVSGNGTWFEQQNSWNVMIVSDTYGTLTISFPKALLVDFPYRWQQVNLNLSTIPSVIRSRDCCWQTQGRPASKEEILNILSNVSNLLISAEFYNGNETVYLDDVIITFMPEPAIRDRRTITGLPYMCDMSFDRVVFPGAHNAGAKNLMWCGGGYASMDRNNQNVEITGMLKHGIRYFDMDIGGCHGISSLFTCHGSNTRGRTIKYIMNEFDAFLNNPLNRNEVVVITIADINGNIDPLLRSYLKEVERFRPTPARILSGELTFFTKEPGDPWPTLGYLVDSNRRIILFVRNIIPLLEEAGIFDERYYLYDTYINRWCTSSCDLREDTRNKCFSAGPGQLVVVSHLCSKGLSNDDLADLCDGWLSSSLWACMEGRVDATGSQPVDVTPNFIIADYVVRYGKMVPAVREMNKWILEKNGFPVNASISLAEGMTHLE